MTDCCAETARLMSLDDALHAARARVRPIEDREQVSLMDSYGRVLAEDLRAGRDLPAWDNSAMDGFAIRAADAAASGPVRLTLVGRSLAGHPFPDTVGPGEATVITTGSPVPAGADSVVMVEHCTVEGDNVTFDGPVKLGQHVRKAGEDIRSSQLLLPHRRQLRPADVAAIAGQGLTRVPVYRRARVAVFSTGDEVTEPGAELTAGGLYDTNRFALVGLLRPMGVEIHDLGILPDDPDRLRASLSEAAERYDALITSGGVSVGMADYLKPVVETLGELHLWRMAIKPGKPVAFGRIGDCRVFGLPGNPVSAMVTFLYFARPLLLDLMNARPEPLPTMRARLTSPLHKAPGRREFVRARLLTGPDGLLQAEPYSHQGSHLLTSMTWANALIDLPDSQGDLETAATVTVLPFAAVGC